MNQKPSSQCVFKQSPILLFPILFPTITCSVLLCVVHAFHH